MKSARQKSVLIVTLGAMIAVANGNAAAALPPEVKKELVELSRELRSVSVMIRKKQVDEAKAVVQKVEDRVKELEIADDERDRSYRALATGLLKAKNLIPVSFEQEVAPILTAKCTGCHGENRASAQLRMDTYANMGKGGQNGPLLIPRNPQRSLMLARIMPTTLILAEVVLVK